MRANVSERTVYFCTRNSDGGMSVLPFLNIHKSLLLADKRGTI